MFYLFIIIFLTDTCQFSKIDTSIIFYITFDYLQHLPKELYGALEESELYNIIYINKGFHSFLPLKCCTRTECFHFKFFWLQELIKKIHETIWINSVALGQYLLYMSARFYTKLTSFTSYIAAPTQTYVMMCWKLENPISWRLIL